MKNRRTPGAAAVIVLSVPLGLVLWALIVWGLA